MFGRVINKRACFLIAVIFTVGILFLIAPQKVMADIASGTYDGVSWKITDDGELILGNGGTQTMTRRTTRYSTSWPWNSYYNSIAKVSVNGTVNLRGSLYAMFFHDTGGAEVSGNWYEQRTGYPNCVSVDLTGADFSAVTNMAFMFCGMKQVETIIFPEDIDTANVTNFERMFCGCPNLAFADVSGFNTANAKSFYYMFDGCNNLEIIDVSGWQTNKVTTMRGTFRRCYKAPVIDVSGWNTSLVTSMYSMFDECRSVASLDVSHFDTHNVTEMHYMFYNCLQLTHLDVSSFNTSKVTNFSHMFRDCQLITSLDVSGFNTRSATDMSNMFRNCYALKTLDVSNFNTSYVTNFDMMFDYCRNLEVIDVSGFNTSRATNLARMFRACEKVRELDVSGFNTSNATTIRTMFQSCKSLTTLDVSSFNTSKVTDMSWTFSSLTAMKSLDLSNFNTSTVTLMESTFRSCPSLESLNISSWDTGSVTSMDAFFTNTKALNEIIVGSKFSFRGNNISEPSRQALLPTPTGEQYTGKWIRDDEAYGPFTPEQMRDGSYTSEMAGTWVWEDGDPFTVIFEAPNEAGGSMPTLRMYVFRDNPLPLNEFVWFNHHFAYWDGSDGSTYTDGEVIPADTFTEGDILTLTAVFEQDNNDAVFSNGEADVYLIGGEMIELPNLPGGTGYQIWEETPSGWQLVDQSNPAGVVPANDTAAASFTNEYVPGTATIQLIATKTLDGQVPQAGAYQFELLDQNGEVVETVSNTDTGVVMFSTLTFRQPGEFNYTVLEVRGDDPAINYDTHEEHVHISVADDGAGNLTAIAEYDSGALAFVNETKPGMLTVTKQTDGGGDPDEVFTFQVRITDDYGRSLDSVQVVIP